MRITIFLNNDYLTIHDYILVQFFIKFKLENCYFIDNTFSND